MYLTNTDTEKLLTSITTMVKMLRVMTVDAGDCESRAILNTYLDTQMELVSSVQHKMEDFNNDHEWWEDHMSSY